MASDPKAVRHGDDSVRPIVSMRIVLTNNLGEMERTSEGLSIVWAGFGDLGAEHSRLNMSACQSLSVLLFLGSGDEDL